jgi:hypothetical protein
VSVKLALYLLEVHPAVLHHRRHQITTTSHGSIAIAPCCHHLLRMISAIEFRGYSAGQCRCPGFSPFELSVGS